MRRNNIRRGTVFPILLILFLGIAIMGYGLYTTQVGPDQAEDNEIDASRGTLSDMLLFRQSVEHTTENGHQLPVSLGRGIPNGPGETSYQMTTTENETVTFSNYSRVCHDDDGSSDNPSTGISSPPCDDEPTEWEFDSSGVVLTADYNHFTNATAYGYEYGNVYSARHHTTEGSDEVQARDLQTPVIDGTVVRFTAVHGNLTAAAEKDIPVSISAKHSEPVGFSFEHSVSDSGDAQPPTLRIPTELPLSAWEQGLESERIENGGHVTSISYENASGQPTVGAENDATTNYVEIKLETGVRYDAAVHVVRVDA